jgi:hypothetical protein
MMGIRTLLLLAAASILLTVTVSWACTLWAPYTTATLPPDRPLADGYPPTFPGPYGIEGWWETSQGPGVWRAHTLIAHGVENEFTYWKCPATPAFYRCGWPLFALESTVRFQDYRTGWDLPAAEIARRGLQTNWLPTWLHAQPHRRLPLIPLWPGFAVNTVPAFAAMAGLWLLKRRLSRQPPTQPV